MLLVVAGLLLANGTAFEDPTTTADASLPLPWEDLDAPAWSIPPHATGAQPDAADEGSPSPSATDADAPPSAAGPLAHASQGTPPSGHEPGPDPDATEPPGHEAGARLPEPPSSKPVMPSWPAPQVHGVLPCLRMQSDLVSTKACPSDVIQDMFPARPTPSGVPAVAPPPVSSPGLPWGGAMHATAPWDAQQAGPLSPHLQPSPDDGLGQRPAPVPPSSAGSAWHRVGEPGLAWMVGSAAALGPAALLVKALASLLVRRRASPARALLLGLVREDPGVHVSELVRRSGLGNGTVQHHLRALVEAGALLRVRSGGHTCYVPAGLDPAVVQVRTAARAAATRDVLLRLADGPSTLAALARGAGVPVSSLHYHVDKLRRAGAVEPVRDGQRRALALTPLGRRSLAQQPDVGVAAGQV